LICSYKVFTVNIVPLRYLIGRFFEILREIESGSERKHLRLLRGKQADGEHYYSLWIEDSPQFTAESFNTKMIMHYVVKSWQHHINLAAQTLWAKTYTYGANCQPVCIHTVSFLF
jgi:hypothetical protein